MAKSKPLKVLCTYRIKNGKDADFLQLLEKHWPTLYNAGLATGDPAQVLQGQDKTGRTVFIEMFSWKDASAPDVAHQTPEVMAVWEPMGALAEEMNFWAVETVSMGFAKE
jgi:quinol monooxygenase YgiN